MLKPPDSANRRPIPPDNQGLTPRSAAAMQPRAMVGHAGLAQAAARQHGLEESDQVVAARIGARGPAAAEGGPAARTGEDTNGRGRDAASWTGERDATGLGREAASPAGDGDPRGAASQPAPSWSHDWLQLSHELRTPLNAILGNIELLLDGSAGPLAAPARACIGDIQVASRQLLHQLQPLLLLVRARTSGALASRMPLDLLALIRQASADATRRREQEPSQRADVPCHGAAMPGAGPPEPASRSAPTSLMVPGDPVWLGALAAALVDLHAAAPGAQGPLSIAVEAPQPGAGVVLRAFWAGLDPATASPVPLALIDAVLALHGGRIRGFCSDGLRLDLPTAVAISEGPGNGRR
jgi:hypothetical protein